MTSSSSQCATLTPVAMSAPILDAPCDQPLPDQIASLPMLERAASKAVISINTFPLNESPLPLEFGVFKKSIYDVDKISKLAIKINDERFDPFQQNRMIPILLSRGDLQEDCIKTDVAYGAVAPPLILSEAGMQRSSLIVCDGMCRYLAVRSLRKMIKDIMDGLSIDIKRRNEMIASGLWEEDGLREVLEERRVLKLELDSYEEELSEYNLWGVIVYDIDIVYQEGLGCYLGITKNDDNPQSPISTDAQLNEDQL